MTGGRLWRTARGSALVAWPVLQSAAAAIAAWLIARHVVGHQEPFFAPIAAVIALNASIGERGRNAVRLVLGVAVGIVAGEIALGLFGSGTVALGAGTLAAMAAARALGGARVVIAQAASGAILTVATGDHIGSERLIDALTGAGVALVFTQLLFSPEPIGLLRRVESSVLTEMAAALGLTARALRDGNPALHDEAMARQRELRARLGELGRMRVASDRTARHSLVWRSSVKPLVHERENAGHLDLLGGSVLMITRTGLGLDSRERVRLAPSVDALAAVLTDLAAKPGDRTTRQAAADRALATVRDIDAAGAPPGSPLAAAVAALQLAITDVVVFAGVHADQAAAAVRAGSGAIAVAKPPSTPRNPLRRLWRWLRR